MDKDMHWREAKQILEEDIIARQHIIDNVYPWWIKLRVPFVIQSIVVAALCVSIIILANTLNDVVDRRNKDDQLIECYNLYSNDITQAASIVQTTLARVNTTGWESLIQFADTNDISDSTIDHLQILIDDVYDSLAAEQYAIRRQTIWINDNRPLPCPLLTLESN